MTTQQPLSQANRLAHRIAGICLTYPDQDLVNSIPELKEAAHGHHRLTGFLDHVRCTPLMELAAHYTDVFDFKSRRSLYLSWWQDGDTRRRGASLVRFKQVYRSHKLEFTGAELPDFLPVVLDYTATVGNADLLQEHRSGLELLRLALADAQTPYAAVVEAVCATLPGPSPKDRAQALALARSGPPREEVGLAPYGAAR
ncbi:nitrate reductase molybdenum cofactor assembly chaperone [Streptacidiphilus sp. MAP5-52]|uniref:nitrate reductase molybdenum cofactor assembly chaperone n=1 Tax=Streptacidiphilus sp. MAP5-52 TaxID=3156267 RepID=UPI0035158EAB